MARIRTIKPEFFRHEALQDLERENAGCYIMLVFAGLWTQCDSNGVFEYRPRQLKLDILPFLDFDIEQTLTLLQGEGFINVYTAEDGKSYGLVGTFRDHQRITGKEADGGRFPLPGNTRETLGKHPGHNGETQVAQEREREKEREKEINNCASELFFEEFWNAYPHPPGLEKRRDSELLFWAFVRGDRLVNGDRFEPDFVVAQAKKFAEFQARNKADPKFNPNALTWLRNKGFTQDLEPKQSQNELERLMEINGIEHEKTSA